MTGNARKVLIMAGGTGGHIFPGLAVADVLRKRGIEVSWLGAAGGMEGERVPQHGIPIDEVDISGVRGKGMTGWLTLPLRLLKAVRDARSSMLRSQPDCAVSFGGYAAGPGGIAAWLRGIPLIVHEQNQVPGMTNRVLAKLASVVFQAFPGTFPKRSGAVTCGNPVREAVVALPEPDARFFQRRNQVRLLVTGGSQGAQSLNQNIPEALALLSADARPLVCHQAGTGNAQALEQAYQSIGISAEVHEFIEDITDAYKWADLVICRAGALTVSELAAAGLGSILIPYPHAVDDHQTRNAGFLVNAGAACLIPEKDLTPKRLADQLEKLLVDRPAMLEMARKARSAGLNDAAQRVADACEQWIES
jgi:UDP-N-acetylglucosamine--N-acetylmuramyl-(pentapeptide) pyrophosphoryl-undecaprenol N-acetylglucosamine transferase